MPGPMPRRLCRTGWDMEVREERLEQRFSRAAQRSRIASRAPVVNECLSDTGSPKELRSSARLSHVHVGAKRLRTFNEMRRNNASTSPRRRNEALGDLHLQRQIIHLRDR